MDQASGSLYVTVASIREKRDLLKGICPEAADSGAYYPYEEQGVRKLRSASR